MFLAVFGLFMRFGFERAGEDTLSDLLVEADALSSSLLDEGFPANWTVGNVVSPGVTNGRNRIVISKLSDFSALDYASTRTQFGIRNHYLFYFEGRDGIPLEMELSGGPQTYFGKPGVTAMTLETDEPVKDIVAITRYVVADSDVVRMQVLLWNTR